MCKILFTALITTLIGSVAIADTTWVPAGNVSGVWTRAGSPYAVTGNITISDGSILQINPGVTVLFMDTVGVSVSGGATLVAAGEAGDSVRFTADTTANPHGWNGILLRDPTTVAAFAFCVFERSRDAYSGEGDGAVKIGPGMTVEITHSTFRFNHGFEPAALSAWQADSILVTDCLFELNTAVNGAAMQWISSAGLVTRCVFRDNSSTRGGALDCFAHGNERLIFYDCDFIGNHAEYGGAVWLEAVAASGGLAFDSCRFSGNSAQVWGGAFWGWTVPKIDRCWFDDNEADSLGGAIYCTGMATIDRSVFTGNVSRTGGAIALYPSSQELPVVRRCTLIGNRASRSGAAVELSRPAVMNNCLLAFNEGEAEALGLPWIGDPTTIGWNLLYGNEGGDLSPDYEGMIGEITMTNHNGDPCDYYYNIFLDPLLVDVVTGDFHLQPDSPCIDAGRHYSSQFPFRDPDSTISDIGAFPFDQTDVADARSQAPNAFALLQNYPNPFNATTTISFDLPREGRVALRVFDLTGRDVATLIDRELAAGEHRVRFDAGELASGVYFYRLHAGEFVDAKKMVVLK